MLKIFISTLVLNLKLFFPIPAAASAFPESIIGYTTSYSSVSIQSLWETESLQWKVESTIKGYLFSSPIYPCTTGKDNVLTFSLLDFTEETEEANTKTKGKETQRKA